MPHTFLLRKQLGLPQSRRGAHHFEHYDVVSQGTQDPDEGHYEHEQSQDDQDDGRGQKQSIQGLVALPFHLGVDSDGHNCAANQLQHNKQLSAWERLIHIEVTSK